MVLSFPYDDVAVPVKSNGYADWLAIVNDVHRVHTDLKR